MALPVSVSTIGHHDLGEFRRPERGVQVIARFLLEPHEIYFFARHLLHGAHAIDVLGQRPVDDGAGRAGPDERSSRSGQPDHAHDQQDDEHRQRQQRELHVQPQQYRDDTDQQQHVAERSDQGVQKFLQCSDVALQARHQAPDLGLVHERHRQPLEVRVHGAPQVEQNAFPGLADDDLLSQAGNRIDRYNHGECQHGRDQQSDIHNARNESLVDGGSNNERNQQLARGKQHDTDDGEHEGPAIGTHESDETTDDVAVEGCAEYLLVDIVPVF